jgi:hypothetical protein
MKFLKILTLAPVALALGIAGCSGSSTGESHDEEEGDDCNVPECILRMYDLIVSCAPMGTCVEQASETGTNQCYSDGRRLSIMMSDGNGNLRLTNPDGSTCVSEDFVNDGGTFNVVIRDASGAALGTAVTNADGFATITCDGRTYQESEYDCDGDDDDGDNEGPVCTIGTCP